MTSTSIQKRGARKIAQLFRDEVLNSQFTFNHLSFDDAVWADCWAKLYECNGYFPTMKGYSMTDERSRYGGGDGHWSDNLTFVQWNGGESMNRSLDGPEIMIGDDQTQYQIVDGITNYWDGSIPKYLVVDIDLLGGGYLTYIDSEQINRYVPIEVSCPCDETATDIMRRVQYYTKNLCIWGLKDCHCSSTGSICNKTEYDITGYKFGSISHTHF